MYPKQIKTAIEYKPTSYFKFYTTRSHSANPSSVLLAITQA